METAQEWIDAGAEKVCLRAIFFFFFFLMRIVIDAPMYSPRNMSLFSGDCYQLPLP